MKIQLYELHLDINNLSKKILRLSIRVTPDTAQYATFLQKLLQGWHLTTPDMWTYSSSTPILRELRWVFDFYDTMPLLGASQRFSPASF